MQTALETNASSIERSIARRLIRHILAQGFVVSVCDGEETTVSKSRDERGILAALATAEIDVVSAYDNAGSFVACFYLIWGNDEDLISDYTDTPAADAIAAAAQAEAAR